MRIKDVQAGALLPDQVTSAMLDAGRDEYWDHDVDDEGSTAVLTDVFLAMAAAGGWMPPNRTE